MTKEQRQEIENKICELIGSSAKVAFYSNNFSPPHISVFKTGTGYPITETMNGKRTMSCYTSRDYNTIIKVLNKIIQQAKFNLGG